MHGLGKYPASISAVGRTLPGTGHEPPGGGPDQRSVARSGWLKNRFGSARTGFFCAAVGLSRTLRDRQSSRQPSDAKNTQRLKYSQRLRSNPRFTVERQPFDILEFGNRMARSGADGQGCVSRMARRRNPRFGNFGGDEHALRKDQLQGGTEGYDGVGRDRGDGRRGPGRRL